MAEDKKYSLISVDVAPDEEVLHVDASGVHAQTAPVRSDVADSADSAQAVADGIDAGNGDHAAGAVASDRRFDVPSAGDGGSSSGKDAAGEAAPLRSDSQDSYQATQEDLEGPVPMAGLQKVIIAVVVLCLVGFAVYFGLNH